MGGCGGRKWTWWWWRNYRSAKGSIEGRESQLRMLWCGRSGQCRQVRRLFGRGRGVSQGATGVGTVGQVAQACRARVQTSDGSRRQQRARRGRAGRSRASRGRTGRQIGGVRKARPKTGSDAGGAAQLVLKPAEAEGSEPRACQSCAMAQGRGMAPMSASLSVGGARLLHWLHLPHCAFSKLLACAPCHGLGCCH